MDEHTPPPDGGDDVPPAGGIPDDDEFLNSLFAESGQQPQTPALPPDRRGGKARERYQKRRDKAPPPDMSQDTKPHAAVSGDADTPSSERRRGQRAQQAVSQTQPVPRLRQSQVSVPGGFKLPQIDFRKYSVYAYAAIALIVLVGVILLLGLFKNDPAPSYPNAIWIGSEWTFEQPSNEQVEALAARLKQNGIGTVYAWVSFLKGDNEWSGLRASTNTFEEVEANVATFVTQFRRAYPEANLYGWVSVPTELGVEQADLDEGIDRLDETVVINEIARFSASVIRDLGFDGVMLNAEPVWSSDSEKYIALLQAVRRAVGDAPLAVAVFPDWSPAAANIPKPPLITPGTEYSTEFKQRISLLADEVMVMAYNSGLGTAPDYAEWVAYQTQTYAEAIAAVEGGAVVRVGIPTYPSDAQSQLDPPAHDVNVENIPSAVNGVINGLALAGNAARVINGVAIYAEWETDDEEWRLFEQFWIQR